MGRKLIFANVLGMLLLGTLLFVYAPSTHIPHLVISFFYCAIFIVHFALFCIIALSSLPSRVRYVLLNAVFMFQALFLMTALSPDSFQYPSPLGTVTVICLFLASGSLLLGIANWQVDSYEHSIGDRLTGLFNPRYFETALEHFLNSQDRRNTPSCLLSLDIDNVEEIARQFTHGKSDQAIGMIAEVLKETTRASDVVCHSGNEEFEALLIGCNISFARQVGNRIQTGIQNHPLNTLNLTVSIGITSLIPSDDLNSLRSRVDKAIGCAKQIGRAQVVTV